MSYRKAGLILGVISIILVGCSSAAAPTASEDVSVLQKYLHALVDKDETSYARLICPDWESEAYLEFDAYKGMKSNLGDLSCRHVGDKNGVSQVNCQGKIQLSYGSENQIVDLSPRTYQLAPANGSWQVCGFTTAGQ